jgi:uncharacterized coiled-coil DUF342 family protein
MSTLDDQMRARFHQAGREKDAILAQTAAQRAEADAITAQADELYARAKAIFAKVKEAEAPIIELDNERGRLARALNGKTGTP